MMAWLERLFALTCHQLPERSPQFDGVVFPLCFRLAGLYLGTFTSYACLMIVRWRGRTRVREQIIFVALLVPLVVDGWANTLQIWSSPDSVRALTGLSAGVVIPVLLAPLARRPQSGNSFLFTVVQAALLASGLLVLLSHPGSATVFMILGLLAAAGFLLLLGNLIWAARPVLSHD